MCWSRRTTDAGTVPNLKFPYALAHNRVLSGGWAREMTTRELPIAPRSRASTCA